ncbi:hypothetical protein AB0I94_25055 [Streptomyces sp. NPDC050147]|uniref:hypothetical protein n=1 Tax=Streptomyces sp. NPDC050147 TaxID=3155513 RepID=UPI00342A15BB
MTTPGSRLSSTARPRRRDCAPWRSAVRSARSTATTSPCIWRGSRRSRGPRSRSARAERSSAPSGAWSKDHDPGTTSGRCGTPPRSPPCICCAARQVRTWAPAARRPARRPPGGRRGRSRRRDRLGLSAQPACVLALAATDTSPAADLVVAADRIADAFALALALYLNAIHPMTATATLDGVTHAVLPAASDDAARWLAEAFLERIGERASVVIGVGRVAARPEDLRRSRAGVAGAQSDDRAVRRAAVGGDPVGQFEEQGIPVDSGEAGGPEVGPPLAQDP